MGAHGYADDRHRYAYKQGMAGGQTQSVPYSPPPPRSILYCRDFRKRQSLRKGVRCLSWCAGFFQPGLLNERAYRRKTISGSLWHKPGLRSALLCQLSPCARYSLRHRSSFYRF